MLRWPFWHHQFNITEQVPTVYICIKNGISWYYICFLCKGNQVTAAFQDLLDSFVKSKYSANTNFASVKFVKIFSKKLNNLSWLPRMSRCFLKGGISYSKVTVLRIWGGGWWWCWEWWCWPQWEKRYLGNIICDENKNLQRPPIKATGKCSSPRCVWHSLAS